MHSLVLLGLRPWQAPLPSLIHSQLPMEHRMSISILNRTVDASPVGANHEHSFYIVPSSSLYTTPSFLPVGYLIVDASEGAGAFSGKAGHRAGSSPPQVARPVKPKKTQAIGNFNPISLAHRFAISYPASACRITPVPGSFHSTRAIRLSASAVPSQTMTTPECCE